MIFIFWCIAAVIFALLDIFIDDLELWGMEAWEDCTDDDFDDFFDHSPFGHNLFDNEPFEHAHISSLSDEHHREINPATGHAMVGIFDTAGNSYGCSDSHNIDSLNSDIFSETETDTFDSFSTDSFYSFDDF